MATLEQFGILCQISDQTYRLVRNMRANANEYIALADAIDAGTATGWTAKALGDTMQADAAQFSSRLAQLTSIAQRNQSAVSAALGIIGETLSSAAALKNSLVNVANHVQAATLNTTTQCRTEANYILSNAPDYDGLF
jgi:hypothetical protein